MRSWNVYLKQAIICISSHYIDQTLLEKNQLSNQKAHIYLLWKGTNLCKYSMVAQIIHLFFSSDQLDQSLSLMGPAS